MELKMDSEEEAYNKFIVDSDGEDGGSSAKQRNTKPEQMKLIAEFVDEYDESTVPKKEYDELWNNLADRLNSFGPPVRNAMDWRRVWTVHKYNIRKQSETSSTRKRARMSSSLSDSTVESDQTVTVPVESKQTVSVLIEPQTQNSPAVECCSLLKLVLEKMDSILVSLEELKRHFLKSE